MLILRNLDILPKHSFLPTAGNLISAACSEETLIWLCENNNEDDTDLYKIGIQFNLLNKETEQNVQCLLMLHPS